MKPELTIHKLKKEASEFSTIETSHNESSLYGVTDGKAVGTYFEHKFVLYLEERYSFLKGNAARGVDLPELGVDIKVTSIRQPQSSCPFKSAKQKIYGLEYSLLVFVYEKTDNHESRTGKLEIKHVIYVDSKHTADYQTTRGIREILDNDGNEDDIIAFMSDRLLPVDDIQASQLAKKILKVKPEQGYLTISNALQWRLQYRRIIDMAGTVEGVYKVI